MHADARKLPWDARRATDRAIHFARTKHFVEYPLDDLLRSAIERQLTIVGEARNPLRQIDPETAGVIPELARVVGFRSVLVHGYASLDKRIVWGVIETNLPTLLTSLENLLAQPSRDS